MANETNDSVLPAPLGPAPLGPPPLGPPTEGSSTPPINKPGSSRETAEPTDDKNAPGAFTSEPGGANDSGPGDDGRIRNGTDTGPDGT